MKRIPRFCNAVAILIAVASTLPAATIQFTLLGDPGQNYTFARADAPSGSMVTEPAGPYPADLGVPKPDDLYLFLCIDYLEDGNLEEHLFGLRLRSGGRDIREDDGTIGGGCLPGH